MTRRALTAAVLSVVIAGCATSQSEDDQTDQTASPASAATDQEPTVPAGATDAVQRLASSPRHGEWAMIPVPDGDSLRAWVVYPERSTPAPVVLVVHEIYGLTNWIRGVADQLAADGFLAIAPDLLTAKNLPADASGDPVREQATTEIRTLQPENYHPQLVAVANWGMALPSAADSYGIVGFCWGGSASFRHAIESSSVDAAVVFYGSSPDTDMLSRVNAPVLGLYGGDDARVNATVPPADSAMRALGKSFEYHMFDGAGHGFLRQQDGRDGANMAATRASWPLTVRFLRSHLR